MFSHLRPLELPRTERNQVFFCLRSHPVELLQQHTTGKHNAFKKSLNEILHTFHKKMCTTLVILYVSYENIIANILPHQVVNKNSIIASISIFLCVNVIIIVL